MPSLSIKQAALVRIEEEEAKLHTLRTAVFEQGVLRWSEAHQPILSTCRVDLLETALEDSVAFGARTKEGLFLQEAARAVLKMRQAVIAVGDGDWTSEQRESVEAVVQASVPLHPEVPELQQAAERVAVRAQVRDIVILLEQSIAVLHHEALKMALLQVSAPNTTPEAGPPLRVSASVPESFSAQAAPPCKA